MSVEGIRRLISVIAVVILLLLARQIRDLIVSVIQDLRWLIRHLIFLPLKRIGKGIAFVLRFPARAMKRRRLKESQFNVIPGKDCSTC